MMDASQRTGIKSQLIVNTHEAIALSVFGVLSYFVGEQMYFGQDRLHFVELTLQADRQNI